MAKVIISETKLEALVQRWLVANAEAALIDYTAQPLELDDPDYPFARHPGERSIRDPASQSITPIPGGVRIKVEARGAPFIEEGNDGSGDTIEAYDPKGLFIPLKTNRGPRGKIQNIGGKWFFVTQSVLAYEGRHLLGNAVRKAFGIFPR